MFGRHHLANERGGPVTLRKILTASVARDKMEFSSERILETFVCNRELDSVLVLKDTADELDGDIVK